jgi:hypothetical protein
MEAAIDSESPRAPLGAHAASEALRSGTAINRPGLAREVFDLQRQYGNRHVQRLVSENSRVLRQAMPGQAGGLIQRQPRDQDAKDAPEIPQTTASGPDQQLFAVRDNRLNLGGTLVSDLESLKTRLMSTKTKTDWTLVIAMHGSQELLGAQAPPDWQKDAKFYKAEDIERLFNGDKDFVKWRDQFGPAYLSLVACQVSKSFEAKLIANFTRAGSRQRPQGLGAGCKPIAYSQTVNGFPDTREAFEKLPVGKRNEAIRRLKELNEKWGYYGAPPVPESLLEHYYYDEDPKGEWAFVEVRTGTGHELKDLKSTGIPFWNRTTGPDAAKFRDLCDQGAEKWEEHKGGVPDVKEEGEASGGKKRKKPKIDW